jgi:hypothetical protein
MQRAEPWNRSVLGIAAAVEAVTGLLLIVVPHLLAKLLLGVGCWFGRQEATGGWALSAMLTYDLLVTAYLLVVGLGTEFLGPLLWPAWRRMPFLPRCSPVSG